MWRFAAAKAIGTSHLRAGLPCQDHFICGQVGEGYFACALADGAGSASMGDRGAEMAVQQAFGVISSHRVMEGIDLSGLILEAVIEARSLIQSTAQCEAIAPREFACTLLVVIFGPTGGVAAQIGDGVIVVRSGEDAWGWVFWPQHGEFVNTTRFLTDDDAMEQLQTDALPDEVVDMILLTDGLERLALDMVARTTHDPFFDGLITPLVLTEGMGEKTQLSQHLESFLVSERVMARTDDDLSLILATRRAQPLGS